MSHTKTIALNSIVQIVGKFFTTGLGLIAMAIMTRYLGAEKFGWYVTTITFLGIIGIMIDFGLIPVSAQMLGEKKHDEKILFSNLLAFRVITAAVSFLVMPFFAFFFPYPPIVKISILLTALSFFCVSVNQVFTGFYQQKLKMHLPVIGDTLGKTVLVVGLWILVFFKSRFLPFMMVIVASNIAYTAFMWIAAKKIMDFSFAYDAKIWKEIGKKMWPVAISIIFNMVYLRGDVMILSFLRPQEEVGLYGAPYRVIDILNNVSMMIMGVILPILAMHWSMNDKEKFFRQYQQAFNGIMFAGAPIVVSLFALSDKIMIFVAGNDFAASSDILRILSLAVLGVYIGSVFGHVAVAIDQQKRTIWIYATNAIISLICYLIFIPMYGMNAAAWITVFSELYAGLLLFFVIQKYLKGKMSMNRNIRIWFSAGVMGLVYMLGNDLHLLLIAPLGLAAYAFTAILVKAVPKETFLEVLKKRK